VGDKLSVDGGDLFCVDHQLVLQNRRLLAEVEIGMVGQIAIGVLVGRRRVVKL
jgi:hypothetical protein